MDILQKGFRRIHAPRQLAHTYWKPIRYGGIYFDELELMSMSSFYKKELLDLVLTYLPEDYIKLGTDFISLLIQTTLYKGGFLLTPLEAYSLLQDTSAMFPDYKVRSTYLSSITIKERILKALTVLWEKYKLDQCSSILDNSINYENYLARNILHPRLEELCPYSLSERLATGNYLHPRILATELVRIKFEEHLSKNCARDLILDLLTVDIELFLLGNLALLDSKGNKHKLKYPCTIIEARTGISLYNRETSIAYYEPLLFTRHDKEKLNKEDTCLHYLEEADSYSKLVRISNLRRRSVSQDSRYIIMSAIHEGFKNVYDKYQKLK